MCVVDGVIVVVLVGVIVIVRVVVIVIVSVMVVDTAIGRVIACVHVVGNVMSTEC